MISHTLLVSSETFSSMSTLDSEEPLRFFAVCVCARAKHCKANAELRLCSFVTGPEPTAGLPCIARQSERRFVVLSRSPRLVDADLFSPLNRMSRSVWVAVSSPDKNRTVPLGPTQHFMSSRTSSCTSSSISSKKSNSDQLFSLTCTFFNVRCLPISGGSWESFACTFPFIIVLSMKGGFSSEPWLQRSNIIEEGNEAALASEESEAIADTTKTLQSSNKT